MKLENYFPTFRGIVLERVAQELKTKSGLFIPATASDNTPVDEISWKVLKIGKDCTEVQKGDIVYLSRGIYPEPVGQKHFQVMEMQVKGIERTNDARIRTTHTGKSKATRSSKLQKG